HVTTIENAERDQERPKCSDQDCPSNVRGEGPVHELTHQISPTDAGRHQQRPGPRAKREEPRDLFGPERTRVPSAVKHDVPPDPEDVRLLGAATHMPRPNGGTDAVQ